MTTNSYLQEIAFWSIICQQDIRGYESDIKHWLGQFQTIQDISKSQLDDAFNANKLRMTKKQLQKFKIEFEKAKSQRQNFSKDHIFKMLLDYLKPNSEYDVLLVVKRLKVLIHIEIKSSSTGGNISCEETERYKGFDLRPGQLLLRHKTRTTSN